MKLSENRKPITFERVREAYDVTEALVDTVGSYIDTCYACAKSTPEKPAIVVSEIQKQTNAVIKQTSRLSLDAQTLRQVHANIYAIASSLQKKFLEKYSLRSERAILRACNMLLPHEHRLHENDIVDIDLADPFSIVLTLTPDAYVKIDSEESDAQCYPESIFVFINPLQGEKELTDSKRHERMHILLDPIMPKIYALDAFEHMLFSENGTLRLPPIESVTILIQEELITSFESIHHKRFLHEDDTRLKRPFAKNRTYNRYANVYETAGLIFDTFIAMLSVIAQVNKDNPKAKTEILTYQRRLKRAFIEIVESIEHMSTSIHDSVDTYAQSHSEAETSTYMQKCIRRAEIKMALFAPATYKTHLVRIPHIIQKKAWRRTS